MGTFRIEITANGGHGCSRDIKDGGNVAGCGQKGCPDCETRVFVEYLKQRNSVVAAVLIHWPGEPGEVQDNLLTGVRKGSF